MRQSVNGETHGGEALEDLAIDGYRTSQLSAGEVAGIRGLATSLEALDRLGRRGIVLNYSIRIPRSL